MKLGQRIMIIGASGAGKSTLARALHQKLGLPLIHLDQHYWLSGWVESEREDWLVRANELTKQERWIMDGNYGSTMAKRIERAETIVFLDYSTMTCLYQALKRLWRYRGKTRPDMVANCPERFDWQFYHYIASYRFARRPGIMKKLAAARAAKQVFILRNRRATNNWLNQLALP